MSKGIIDTIIGGVEIAGAIALATVSFGGAAPLIGWTVASFIIAAGAGMVLTGIGTLLQGNGVGGVVSSSRNPIRPWDVIYGRARKGGSIITCECDGGDK